VQLQNENNTLQVQRLEFENEKNRLKLKSLDLEVKLSNASQLIEQLNQDKEQAELYKLIRFLILYNFV
jgi:hypothetical protein